LPFPIACWIVRHGKSSLPDFTETSYYCKCYSWEILFLFTTASTLVIFYFLLFKVATPGEILNNLRHTQGFSLALGRLKYLVWFDFCLLCFVFTLQNQIFNCLTALHFEQVIDDAHLLLNDHSEQQLCDISEMIPTEPTTFLFSSTLTEKVNRKKDQLTPRVTWKSCSKS
jgi:hypothetical protein